MAGEVTYDVRFTDFHPITGKFSAFRLSSSQLQWGIYSSSTITLNSVNPAEGIGKYQVVAGADGDLYISSGFTGTTNPDITTSAPTVTFGTLAVRSPYTGNIVAGVISMSSTTKMDNMMDAGFVFAVHGGLIVDVISTSRGDLPLSDVKTGGTYTISNLPGGTTLNPQPSAIYGVDAAFWTSTPSIHKAIGIPPLVVDLRGGSTGTADLQMSPLW